MRGILQRLRSDEGGVTAIEYAFIAALIAVAIVTAVGAVGQALNGPFARVVEKL